MTKETTIITIASILFIATWLIVIFQIYEKREVEPLQFEPTALEDELPFFDEFDEEDVEKIEDVEKTEDEIEEQVKEDEQRQMIDLRDYDFSDIETPQGIPIDALLDKLELIDE